MSVHKDKLDKLTSIDKTIWASGISFAGIDEVGRGSLAGPVLAACVIMPEEPLILGINDSKVLSERRRNMLHEVILETAVHIGIGSASVEEIEKVNIREATKLAIKRAVEKAPCTRFLIDGDMRVDLPGECVPIVKGDSSSYSIAAASIVAKVTRDRIMQTLHEEYPQYLLYKNKGYGTPEHFAALREHGPCPAHRMSFLKKLKTQEK